MSGGVVKGKLRQKCSREGSQQSGQPKLNNQVMINNLFKLLNPAQQTKQAPQPKQNERAAELYAMLVKGAKKKSTVTGV